MICPSLFPFPAPLLIYVSFPLYLLVSGHYYVWTSVALPLLSDLSARFVNNLLGLKADRAMEMLKNITAVKPMEESEINALLVQALDCLCEDLVPTSVLDGKHRM